MNDNTLFYCDCCGHAFRHPRQIYNRPNDERCPKCSNPDFEQIKPEKIEEEEGTGSGRHSRERKRSSTMFEKMQIRLR